MKTPALAMAFGVVAVFSTILAAQSPVDGLARDVERAEAIRAVKTVQRTYAQYSQYGLWNDMAALFADESRLIIGDESATGRAAIAAFLTTRLGAGRQGLAAGVVHTQLIDQPLDELRVFRNGTDDPRGDSQTQPRREARLFC